FGQIPVPIFYMKAALDRRKSPLVLALVREIVINTSHRCEQLRRISVPVTKTMQSPRHHATSVPCAGRNRGNCVPSARRKNLIRTVWHFGPTGCAEKHRLAVIA